MERKYFITQDQLEEFDHYRTMFELTADGILDLCKSEKDDIVYGFELGQMHSLLRNKSLKMLELRNEIADQKVVDETK